ncbi:MFS transporter [Cryptosporangium minutisporangium]|uniref:MFS transporter n=1 Tax=Cryptosporangium minutisporangium TaxID=113569 RepID=A0ABP6SS83_9ACTN
MAQPSSPGTTRTTASRRELGWALGVLCLTEIVSWGVLYYAFPVLAADITADTGWSPATITAAFSAGLVVSALAGIPVGHLMHHHGPRWLMTGGSALAVVSVLVLATAPSLPLFVAGWLLAGVAMSCVLYAPAFAAVTVWFGPRRVPALTAVTLVAGFASTVFAPLTAVLDEHFSWRGTYLILAVLLAVLTVPAHWFGLRPAWPKAEAAGPTATAQEGEPSPDDRPVRPVEFWVLAAAFTVNAVCLYATVINLVPLLHERGYSTTAAAWVLGIGGIGQVLGRLAYAPLVGCAGLPTRTLVIFAGSALTTGLFAVLPGPYAALIVVALVAGNVRGMATLLSATAVSDRWGTARFARLNGVFNAPMMLATAVSPFIGAWLAGPLGGYPEAFLALAVLGAVAVGLATLPGPGRTPRS